MTAVAVDFEAILQREGLAPLDRPGGISSRGTPHPNNTSFPRESVAAERSQRGVILATHRFRPKGQAVGGRRLKLGEKRVYAFYASGLSIRTIAHRTGLGRMAVYRIVSRIEREHRKTPEQRLGAVMAACDPQTIILFFWLLERSLEAPDEVRELIAKARANPEVRALLEPDEVRNG